MDGLKWRKGGGDEMKKVMEAGALRDVVNWGLW